MSSRNVCLSAFDRNEKCNHGMQSSETLWNAFEIFSTVNVFPCRPCGLREPHSSPPTDSPASWSGLRWSPCLWWVALSALRSLCGAPRSDRYRTLLSLLHCAHCVWPLAVILTVHYCLFCCCLEWDLYWSHKRVYHIIREVPNEHHHMCSLWSELPALPTVFWSGHTSVKMRSST